MNHQDHEPVITTCYFIRRKSDPNAYWSNREGWTDRAHADLHGHLSLTSSAIQLPQDGVWVDSYYGSLEEHHDRQEDAGIEVDPAIRPSFPSGASGRYVPEYSFEQYLDGTAIQQK